MKRIIFTTFIINVLLIGVAFAIPQEATLISAIQAPLIINGKQVGSMKLPAGSTVIIISIVGDGVMVNRGGSVQFKVPREVFSSEALALATATPSPAPLSKAAPSPSLSDTKNSTKSLTNTPQSSPAPHSNPSSTPPRYPSGFVGNPEFETTAGRESAGTAFLATPHAGASIYLLTVRHLLGPMGGFKQLTPPEKVPSFVRAISLHSLEGRGTLKSNYLVNGLSVPSTSDEHAPLFDLAIFKANTADRSDALDLAAEKPPLGEKVWVIAHVAGGVPEGTYIHPAKVIENGDSWLICEFENPNIQTSGASGAPVLDVDGNVVGIYSGHLKEKDKMLAFVIPSTQILQIIQTADHFSQR